MRSRAPLLVVVGCSILLLVGCARFRPEPLYIKFPPPPSLTWQLCHVPEEPIAQLCLSQAEAAALNKWMDKVRAFEAARERLTRE